MLAVLQTLKLNNCVKQSPPPTPIWTKITSNKQQRQRTLHTWKHSDIAHDLFHIYLTIWWQQYNSTLLRRRSREHARARHKQKPYMDCIVRLRSSEPINQPTSTMPGGAQGQMPNERNLDFEQELLASTSVWPRSYIPLMQLLNIIMTTV